MRKKMIFIAFLIVLLGILGGCGKQESMLEPTLWVVTEPSKQEGINAVTELLIAQFEEANPGVTIELQYLPTEKSERELVFKRLRTQIMAGQGPDVFLLPGHNASITGDGGSTSPFNPGKTTGHILVSWNDMLFNDVNKAMQNGLFADISSFYDADDALEKDALNEAVMDAGTYNGCRYILPIRYDFPVLFVDETVLNAEYGITLDQVDSGIMEVLDTVLATDSQTLACGAEPFFIRYRNALSLLPETMNYQTGTTLLEKEVLVDFLTKFQQLEEQIADEDFQRQGVDHENYINHSYLLDFYWEEVNGKNRAHYEYGEFPVFMLGYPMQMGWLSQAHFAAAIAAAEERPIAMVPMRALDGDLVANITYYGAVGAGCETPELAYSFLRMFLLEETQWEKNRVLIEDEIEKFYYGKAIIWDHLEDGWPVRNTGSAGEMWEPLRSCVRAFAAEDAEKSRQRRLQQVRLTDADVPVLDAQIDRVYFPIGLEQSEICPVFFSLNNWYTGEKTDADIDLLADEILALLQWTAAEG